MNPLAAEQLARTHYQDLVHLAQADQAARSLRPVSPWRRAVGQALVGAAVGVGLPRTRRPVVLREARALLADDCCRA
ncbi:MAG: hypothetical protein ACRD2W_18520 [Acidimicrobiales bacterium]